MTLSDINESGKATLSFIANNVQGSILIDLTTGKLFKMPGAKSLSSPKEEPVLVENRLESPSGRYVLECSDNASEPILIKTSAGRTLGTISRKQFPGISEMDFSPRERYISFINNTPPSKKWSSPLYVYSIAEKKLFPIGDGDIRDFGWSKDDRFFWYVSSPSNQPTTLGGSLRVTDATAGFSRQC